MRTSFGTTDNSTCPECKNLMRLTRRTPHPKYGYDFELQTFTCRLAGMRLREMPIAEARSQHDHPRDTAADALIPQDDIERSRQRGARLRA